MKMCTELANTTKLGAYVIAIAIAVGGGMVLYKLLTPLRRGNAVVRFVGRTIIIGGGLMLFGLTALKVGGPCVFVGQSKYGGYMSDPITGRGVLLAALVGGVVCAIIVPLVARTRDGGKVSLEW